MDTQQLAAPFAVPTLQQVSSDAKTLLEQVQKRIGMLPNLYATIGYSAGALKGMLDFENALAHGSHFTAKEREAINLVVSQVNDCAYCLAAHTALAKAKGFTEDETLAIRKAAIADPKLNTIVRLAQSVAANKGKADPQLLDAFEKAGFHEGALMELLGWISLRTFTNYVYANTGIPIDFPEAPALH
ncbi:uncharacterized peroxidase-related enzyme [Catalinimonas alkaloidigena]|uniref:Uncharacterized peroxidase-related enzyme n=1 Tax=Catalinimonas alkaloidigena TaxID=1075417 RepID=A0A1G9P4X6_9BACT|nr:carboxymuconolactone decarboxylase family protein [Catalinimonas alkaloidigena]SDL93561.1 uncharacterized peroxidase-related enzyme [Catalinimonas alkaloidigena]